MGTPKYKTSIVIAALALGAVIALASLFGCRTFHYPWF